MMMSRILGRYFSRLDARFLAEGGLEALRSSLTLPRSDVCDVDGRKGAHAAVEFIAQSYVYIGDLGVGGLPAGPLRQRLEELLSRDEEVRDTLFNLG